MTTVLWCLQMKGGHSPGGGPPWRRGGVAGGRGARTAGHAGARGARWARATPPGPSPVACPGGGGRGQRAGLPRRRPPLPPVRRGRRRAPSRAPGGAPPQRGHRPRSGLSTNGRRAPPRSRRRLRCARPFSPRVRERRGDALAAGRTAAAARAIEALARCAQGLQADLAAVTAGRTRPGSPGPGAGHGNRLQRRKRQGSGRADVGRWRPRVRHAA